MTTSEIPGTPEDASQYWQEMGLVYASPGSRALFMLGYLVAEIGSSQHNENKKSKPILNKLNFAGMDKHQVVRLINEVFEYMRIYDILQFNETAHAVSKAYLDKAFENWRLTPEEAVFFILSGYAFKTMKIMQGGS